MGKKATEYTITLDAEDLHDSIEEAIGEGAEGLELEITFKIVNGKPEVIRKRLEGEINQQYSETI